MGRNIKSFENYISEMATKRGFLDGYKTYDPQKLGYGNPEEWKRAFNRKMGYEEAESIMGDMDPYEILGISRTATPDEIKRAYRKKAMETHPDVNQGRDTTKQFQEVQAAYTILTENR